MIHVDYNQVSTSSISIDDTHGTSVDVDGYVIPVIISNAEAATLLAAYDEADTTSPSEEISREIARAVLSALLRYSTS